MAQDHYGFVLEMYRNNFDPTHAPVSYAEIKFDWSDNMNSIYDDELLNNTRPSSRNRVVHPAMEPSPYLRAVAPLAENFKQQQHQLSHSLPQLPAFRDTPEREEWKQQQHSPLFRETPVAQEEWKDRHRSPDSTRKKRPISAKDPLANLTAKNVAELELRRKRTQEREQAELDYCKKLERATEWRHVRRNSEGVPLHFLPSSQVLEHERRYQAEQAAEEAHRRAIGRVMDRTWEIKNSKGVKIVYDFMGKRVEDGADLRKPPIRPDPRDSKEVQLPKGAPFQGKIIEKTKEHQEKVKRQKEHSDHFEWKLGRGLGFSGGYRESKEKPEDRFRWQPSALPSSTLTVTTSSSVSPTVTFECGGLDSPERLNSKAETLPPSALIQWREYRRLSAGDCLVTIEYCCNCASHDIMTWHDESKYLQLAKDVQSVLEGLLELHPSLRLEVLLKPIKDNVKPVSKDTLRSMTHSSQRVPVDELMLHKVLEESGVLCLGNRIGAFEVQLAARDYSGELKAHILHSKLFSGRFPRLKKLQRLALTALQEFGVLASDSIFQSPASTPVAPQPPTPSFDEMAEQMMQMKLEGQRLDAAVAAAALAAGEKVAADELAAMEEASKQQEEVERNAAAERKKIVDDAATPTFRLDFEKQQADLLARAKIAKVKLERLENAAENREGWDEEA